jgi:hypothetical protein
MTRADGAVLLQLAFNSTAEGPAEAVAMVAAAAEMNVMSCIALLVTDLM